MAKRSTQTNKISIDPLFPVPYGAEDQFVYTHREMDAGPSADSLDSESDTDDYDYDDGYEDSERIILDVPETFTIVSQSIRRAPGGQQVVDIVIEVEDVDGAVNYEMQVTKV